LNVAKDVNEMSRELCAAARDGDFQEVQRLVDNGADIHVKEDYALRWSAQNGHLDIVEFLVSKGSRIHAREDYALRWSAENGHLAVVKFLVDNGADIHADRDYALRWGARMGRFNVVKFLMGKGADIHAGNEWVFKNCNDKMVNFIKSLENNPNNQKSDDQWNTICSNCGAKAYRGFVNFECSKGCE
jgi:ankyrin repeat protein